MQREIEICGSYKLLNELFESNDKVFLVCDGSYPYLKIGNYFDHLPSIVKFSDFQPNPDYKSVKKAVEVYRRNRCETIVAVGGGSAMDLAKCVKLYANMSDASEYIEQEIVPNNIPLIAIPTTAGTGSEATRYAVIYYKGNKQSITHESCIPSIVIFDASALDTLPEYQRKSTMLDALCHAIESFWSVNSTDESQEYSKQAIVLILENMDGYLANDRSCNRNMLKAANIAGKAINITQTTAGHAMCYKLTSLFGFAHGQAAAMCVRKLMSYMIENNDKCIDSRGKAYLEKVLEDIAHAMSCKSAEELCTKFEDIYQTMKFSKCNYTEADIDNLTHSVNPDRLKNHPIKLDLNTIENLYRQILA